MLESDLKEEFTLLRLASRLRLLTICLALFLFGEGKVGTRSKSEGVCGRDQKLGEEELKEYLNEKRVTWVYFLI